MKHAMAQALSVPSGPLVLAGFDASARPLAPTDKAKDLTTDCAALVGLQERLYAEAAVGGQRRVLLVLQGMDTAGKGGVTNHVVSAFEPIGVQYSSFKKPTEEELGHDFLWRIRPRVPSAGLIGVFDRSHYEDVLVPKVHELVDSAEIERRYKAINDFEAELTAAGTTIVKCFLHISFETQRKRLLARLDNRHKHWKFNEADLAERERWSEYVVAYEAVLERCNSVVAPWFVVPSDSKKYRNWAVGELLREVLEELDPKYPDPQLDVESLRARLNASTDE